MGALCGGGGQGRRRRVGDGHHPQPGRRTPDEVGGRRFRPLAPETDPDGHPAGCRRGRSDGTCAIAGTSWTGPEGPPCPRQRVSRVVGLAARLGGSCTGQPPPLALLPGEEAR